MQINDIMVCDSGIGPKNQDDAVTVIKVVWLIEISKKDRKSKFKIDV